MFQIKVFKSHHYPFLIVYFKTTKRQKSLYPDFNTYGRRAFSVAGPTVWNSLPDFIRDPTISADCFRRVLKMNLFARY